MSQHDNKSLLRDLENIRQSLDQIARSEPVVPVLEEVVDKRDPTQVNPDNPFLSSHSLSELIRIRNEAEVKAATELAAMEPLRPIGEIADANQHRETATPNPGVIREQLETLFSRWVDDAIDSYLRLFEQDLRDRLHQDFNKLVAQWFLEAGLPVPDDFIEPPRPTTDAPDSER